MTWQTRTFILHPTTMRKHQLFYLIFFCFSSIGTVVNAGWFFGPSTESFLTAAEKGDINAVKSYLEANGDVDYKNENGITALMWAAFAGHDSDIIDTLINAKTNVNARDLSGKTAMMWGAISGKTQAIQQLLNADADVNEKDAEGKTAFMYATQHSHAAIVQLLEPPSTAKFFRAAKNGNINSVQSCLDNADVNININAQDDNNDKKTALMLASFFGHKKIVQLLINSKADVNVKNENGDTALMWSAFAGHADILQLLLSANADPNISKEKPALVAAAISGNMNIVQFLLTANADVNAKDSDGKTALEWATSSSLIELLTLEMKKVDEKKQLLFSSAKSGDLDKLKTALMNGSGLEEKSKDGYTALLYASAKGHGQMVEYLIEQGANVDAVDNDGISALEYAKKKKHLAIVQKLKDAGAVDYSYLNTASLGKSKDEL